jgi:ADP-ribose pyrophosphatase YjhB (NUDIX family)
MLTGDNVTKNVWIAPGASEVDDGETLNSALSTVAEDIVRVVVPLFWTRTLSIFDEPTRTSPKERLVRIAKTGAAPVPATVTESGELAAECVNRIFPDFGPVPAGANMR